MLNKIKFTIFIVLLALSLQVFAYPLTEKTPATASAPLDILSSQPSRIIVTTFGDFANEYLFAIVGSTSLEIIDLDTWTEYSTQPDAFTAEVVDAALLPNGTSLIVALTDGDLAQIELDDLDTFVDTDETTTDDLDENEDSATDSRQINLSEKMTTAEITHMIADPEQDIVYLVNSSGYFFEYNFNSSTLSETELTNSDSGSTTTDSEGNEVTTSSTYSPTSMAFANSSSGDRIVISTTTGDVIIIIPGSSSYSVASLSDFLSTDDFDHTSPNLAKITVTPDGDYAYALDSDNDVVWAYSIINEDFIDKDSAGNVLDPITITTTANNTFSDIFSYEDGEENVVTYVSGAAGISLIESDSPSDSSDDIVDADTSDATDDEDPIVVSGTPGPLAAASSDAGYFFSANGDATISVFTDNPWITISSIEPSSVTEISSSFVLTFQTDTAGTYTVKVGSNPAGTTGTELIAATSIVDVNTDATTSSIDINSYSRETFVEGTNKVFVHVTDESGNVGHTAVYLTVDRPPEAIEITGVTFGNERIYIDFDASPDSDIASYYLFAEPAEDQTNPTCPGSLVFSGAADTISGSVTPDDCSTSTCEAGLQNLVNDVAYCVAVQVVDEGGQTSSIASYSVAVTPQRTVGPAGFLGETSCSLNARATERPSGFFAQIFSWLLTFLVLLWFRLPKKKIPLSVSIFLVGFFISQTSFAQDRTIPNGERTPQNWSAEIKGSLWYPLDSDVRRFFGACCNFSGEVEFGWLYNNRYNVTATTGFGYKSGNAITLSGTASGDQYSMIMIPFRLDFIYRFDFKPDQFLLPYVRAGGDAVLFKESTNGESITNIKFGVHAGGGLGILLDRIEGMGTELEDDAGVNDVYLTIEARYAMINSFKSTGLDLSGLYPYVGVLFEF